jgi:hypothetical protein
VGGGADTGIEFVDSGSATAHLHAALQAATSRFPPSSLPPSFPVWAAADPPIRVSPNTAGVSLTGSIQHPVFETAFAGAKALGVEPFAPATTAALNGLLTLRDRLDPASAGRPLGELLTTRVRGGIYVTPYPIDPALGVAAAIGMIKDPRRVAGLVRR